MISDVNADSKTTNLKKAQAEASSLILKSRHQAEATTG